VWNAAQVFAVSLSRARLKRNGRQDENAFHPPNFNPLALLVRLRFVFHFLGSLVAFLRGFIGGLLRVLLQRVTGLLGRFLGCAAGILRGLFGGVTSVIHVLLCAGVVLLRNGERARR